MDKNTQLIMDKETIKYFMDKLLESIPENEKDITAYTIDTIKRRSSQLSLLCDSFVISRSITE